MWESWVRSLGWEDPLEKEMAIHSSTIAWKIPWTEEPGRLQSMGSQRVRHDLETGLIYSFPLVRSSCLLSAGVPHAFLCLKVYSWCIHGERCTPHSLTLPPSCSLLEESLRFCSTCSSPFLANSPFITYWLSLVMAFSLCVFHFYVWANFWWRIFTEGLSDWPKLCKHPKRGFSCGSVVFTDFKLVCILEFILRLYVPFRFAHVYNMDKCSTTLSVNFLTLP